ncbi:hypothetical protein V8F20_004403 [Naviculisporaceae sp. PSN 640]
MTQPDHKDEMRSRDHHVFDDRSAGSILSERVLRLHPLSHSCRYRKLTRPRPSHWDTKMPGFLTENRGAWLPTLPLRIPMSKGKLYLKGQGTVFLYTLVEHFGGVVGHGKIMLISRRQVNQVLMRRPQSNDSNLYSHQTFRLWNNREREIHEFSVSYCPDVEAASGSHLSRSHEQAWLRGSEWSNRFEKLACLRLSGEFLGAWK